MVHTHINADVMVACIVWTFAGVMYESDDVHRKAYNAAFEHYKVQCGGYPLCMHTYTVMSHAAALPHWHQGLTIPATPYLIILEVCAMHHSSKPCHQCSLVSVAAVADGADEVLAWDEEFYSALESLMAGGKSKLRWFFGSHGWPSSTVLPGKRLPVTDEERELLMDTLQSYKADKYQDIIT